MFDHYLAFGDSLSIDEYAGPQLGAASLLHRNRADFWPEFDRLDLVSLNPRCGYTRLACNGATLSGVWRQLTEAPRVKGRVLVTVTVGGNDVLTGLGQTENRIGYACGNYFGSEPVQGFEQWRESLHRWLEQVEETYRDAVIIIGNIYDPTDGTGKLQSGASLGTRHFALETMNDLLRRMAAQWSLPLADIHAHFLGQAAAWIYREIEPTQRGSSEIRRIFWQAINP
ncbi:MAG: SGNH/GDSL hydrolase family protein [Candidatus Eremiobacteraeota bacterium]|nr:SGNH/GDSL hydrolase family protein [Candidatus Eremiobacteraeota bacterium]MCW5870379.1 SGNH/GDSL hydrolase family protein [Candidatus Eremiobacteraeota bacterium]